MVKFLAVTELFSNVYEGKRYTNERVRKGNYLSNIILSSLSLWLCVEFYFSNGGASGVKHNVSDVCARILGLQAARRAI
jgi:hypothetical protein